MVNIIKWIPSIKDPYALYLMIRDPRSSIYTRVFSGAIILLIAAYTFSPVDIMPDTIPALGWLDDLFLIPAGLALIEKIFPENIWEENRLKAHRKVNNAVLKVILGSLVFISIWAIIVAAAIFLTVKLINF